jgi:hypothetical protein
MVPTPMKPSQLAKVLSMMKMTLEKTVMGFRTGVQRKEDL